MGAVLGAVADRYEYMAFGAGGEADALARVLRMSPRAARAVIDDLRRVARSMGGKRRKRG